MSLKQTADNLSGTDAVNAAEQLAGIWDGTTATVDAAQLASDLAKADANRKEQISQTEAEIAAEQKQLQANDQAIETCAAQAAAVDLDVARLEGREQQMEAEAAELRK